MDLKSIQHLCSNSKAIIETTATSLDTSWKCIPVHATSWGGLWEAGVRLVKHPLKRIIRNIKLNFIELQTLVAEVEVCVNSRPLLPMSSDPSNLSSLVPSS